MGRYSYDDMPPEGYREKRASSGKMTAAIASIGVIVTLIAIIIYLLFTPHDTSEEETASLSSSVTVVPAEPEIIQSRAVTTEIAEVEEDVGIAEEEPYVRASDEYSAIVYTDRVVADGDTLQSIADDYGLSTATLVSVNKLSGADLAPGTVLRVPPVDGTLCTIEGGDTLQTIAADRNPELTAAELAAINGKAYTAVYPGEEIFVPSPGAIESSVSYKFSSPLPAGNILYRFGDLVDGEPLNGVVIASAPGSAVLAAGDGIVVDIFSHPRFGRSVSLLHENGYQTDYYALETVAVKVSESLSEGDVIGAIGTSNGLFDESAVVFSVEQSGISLDPENLTSF